jgi:hypothetical protein
MSQLTVQCYKLPSIRGYLCSVTCASTSQSIKLLLLISSAGIYAAGCSYRASLLGRAYSRAFTARIIIDQWGSDVTHFSIKWQHGEHKQQRSRSHRRRYDNRLYKYSNCIGYLHQSRSVSYCGKL